MVQLLKSTKHVSNIAKTNEKNQMLKLLKCKKNNLKKLEDSKPRIIETIEKLYDYNHYTQKINIRERCH